MYVLFCTCLRAIVSDKNLYAIQTPCNIQTKDIALIFGKWKKWTKPMLSSLLIMVQPILFLRRLSLSTTVNMRFTFLRK